MGLNLGNKGQSTGNLAVAGRAKSPIGPIIPGGPGGNLPMGPRGAGHHGMQPVSLPRDKAASQLSPSKSILDSVVLFQKMTAEERAEKYVNSQYQCKKKLGSGGFGEVWSCIDLLGLSKSEAKSADEFTFAMKIENLQDVDSKDRDKKDGVVKKQPVPMSQSQLLYEHKIYKILHDGIGIP